METAQYMFFTVVGVCAAIAFVLNTKFQTANPELRPYKWGYFSAAVSVTLGLAMIFAPQIGAAVEGPIWLGASVSITLGVLIFLRTKLGWFFWYASQLITMTSQGWDSPDLGAVVIMIITLVYLKKRWHEFALYPGHQPAASPNER